MAKTFKNLPRPSEPAAAKPTSERDFFDLSDEPQPHHAPAVPASATRTADIIDNTGNTRRGKQISNPDNTSNTGNTRSAKSSKPVDNTDNTGNTAKSTAVSAIPAEPEGVRQTFVLSRGHLEQLRDYVHARRTQGEYTYSQKQALQEALDLLFASAAPAPPRPAYTRTQEEQRGQRIRRGRQAASR